MSISIKKSHARNFELDLLKWRGELRRRESNKITSFNQLIKFKNTFYKYQQQKNINLVFKTSFYFSQENSYYGFPWLSRKICNLNS